MTARHPRTAVPALVRPGGHAVPEPGSALTAVVGTDHLVHGSDFCFTPPEAVERQVASITPTGVL
ncbi:hypothetical protein [Lentzea sp. E54]|uniref:hypothetical protein n=1 Tax=Lentzea xerophila TaxID=3435883 RepID=UPI003DA42532